MWRACPLWSRTTKQASNSSTVQGGGKRRFAGHSRSTVDAFDDPQIALGRIPQNVECRLIRRTIVCSDCLSEALKFNYYGALFNAVLVRLGGDTTREETIASSEDSRNTKLAVVLACCGVGDRTIADHPICLGHCFLSFSE